MYTYISIFAYDIRDYQFGFMKGKSITIYTFTLWKITEKYYEYNKDFHLFFDFKQVYDSINRHHIWIALENSAFLRNQKN